MSSLLSAAKGPAARCNCLPSRCIMLCTYHERGTAWFAARLAMPQARCCPQGCVGMSGGGALIGGTRCRMLALYDEQWDAKGVLLPPRSACCAPPAAEW